MKTCWINGREVDVSSVGANENLLSLLRNHGWSGAKCGCAEGDCGACSVVLLDSDGKPKSINSCLALVPSLEGREIWTAEGLDQGGTLHPVQQAMVDCYGSQCGYCTPGLIASMVEAYHCDSPLTDEQIANRLCGNLCRCTGYRAIRDAMSEALAGKDHPVEFAGVKCDRAPLRGESTVSGGEYLRPESLEELLHLKGKFPDAPLVAGATELAVLINKRHIRYPRLIGLENVAVLRKIERTEDCWVIGAAATLVEVSDAIRREYPALDQMLSVFASRQIRQRATLGGNLVTASPISDAAPVLLALDAEIILISKAGERRLKLDDFFVAYRSTAMKSDEVMSAVVIPRGLSGRSEFHKVSKRREMDISIVSAAFRMDTDEAGLIREVRLAFGGVAATPMRAKMAEQFLLGKPVDASRELFDLLESEFTPLSDVRGSAEYRRILISGLFAKFVFVSGDNTPSDHAYQAFTRTENIPPPILRHESAIGHVTGRAVYTHDQALKRPMLEVWPVLSKHARAKLLEMDVSAALTTPGVRTVLLAKDIPGLNNVGPSRHDEPLFAEDEVFYEGQLIAVVVGENLESCRLAAEKIHVVYEVLKPLLGIQTAIEAESYHTDPHVLDRGDVNTALMNSPHILDGEFEIGGQEHFYLETHSAWAEVDTEGGIHVVSSTQHPSEVQAIVAEVMGRTRNEVVVESLRMGGGFGGKETQGNAWASVCALAAQVTGQAVRIQLDRDVDMRFTGKRHPFHAKFRVGYDDSGRLLAAEVKLFSDGGWSLDLSQPVNDRALFHLDNCYHIPDVKFVGQVVKTNVVSHTAFRGFGGPQGMLVIEEILGRIARRLDLRPEVVREKNFYHGAGESSTTHYGADVGDVRVQRIWRELLKSSEFENRQHEVEGWNAGHPWLKRGLAITPVKFGISFTLKAYNQAGALVLIYQDGSVQVNHGGTEMGQGLHTKILGVVMRELGLPKEAIRLMNTRTDKVPNTSATAASSGSDLNGKAVEDACRQLRDRLSIVASELLGGEAANAVFSAGEVACGAKAMSFGELARAAYNRRVQLSAAGFYRTPELEWDWDVRKGRPFYYYAWGAAVSEVEVDGFTGMTKVRRVDILHDVGDSLNPGVDRGQIEGGFVQGMGWLTQEELKWDEKGSLLTHSASTYAIPAFSDAPADFRVSLLSDAVQSGTIHGSKAVGEPPFMLAISVREAIRDAVAAFGVTGDFYLPSPATGEAVRMAIGDCIRF
ncbi:xanthine dehydrogenase molybdopterin binding subunit [Luteolibacter pohnpeiensis]|uniref:Xanthine dehydrogenase molybdopterin binding subunit n=1 Tax=Luteolibacter pohnpeiensis TaxID=454153 RepID=A0A934S9H6_9BACT|nr:xanthine dehydrogenase molybdopterin binding subunit [Luteolibacter pohnpeiensis]MBK1881283.1 xanthine dehydrogenase molybdopterin binding subunit [Luteolibacter pohnpeiensis]